jgi:hypothetical protein
MSVTGEFLVKFGDRWQTAVNERRLDELLQMFTEDVRVEDPRLESPGAGRNVARSIFETDWRAFPDTRFSRPSNPYFVGVEGDWCAARWRGEGTMLGPLDPPGYAPTNRPFKVDGVDLWQFQDGMVATWVGVFDLVSSSRQLGFLPPVGSAVDRLSVVVQRLTARAHRRQS